MRTLRLKLLATLAAVALLTGATICSAQDFVWAEDFPVGSPAPDIEALDQNGELRRFADLAGDNGLLFMLSRSFDW